MMRRETRWILAAIAFAVVAGLLAWLIVRQDDGSIRLADGRTFRIVGVTYGTNHVFEQGPPWARLMARYGSKNLADRLGYWVSSSLSLSPSVMVWTRWSAIQSNAPPNHASVVDAHGTEIEPKYATVNLPWRKSQDRLLGWRFENYPRHQKEITVRFYEYEMFHVRSHRLSEVTVRNPSPNFITPAPAPSAPITTKDNALECTLVSLHAGEPPPRVPLSARNTIGSWATAEFEFRENGQPPTDWTVKRIDAFSASGNYSSNAQLVVNLVGNLRRVHFSGAFWTNELDWTIRAEVARTRDFLADSWWTIRLPASSLLRPSFQTNVEAASQGLRYFRLNVDPSNRNGMKSDTPNSSIASLTVRFMPVAPDVYLDVAHAADEQGRMVEVRDEEWFWEIQSQTDGKGRSVGNPFRTPPSSYTRRFDLQMPADTEFVDLTFAIHHSRKLEFRVKPVWVSTNVASSFPPSSK